MVAKDDLWFLTHIVLYDCYCLFYGANLNLFMKRNIHASLLCFIFYIDSMCYLARVCGAEILIYISRWARMALRKWSGTSKNIFVYVFMLTLLNCKTMCFPYVPLGHNRNERSWIYFTALLQFKSKELFDIPLFWYFKKTPNVKCVIFLERDHFLDKLSKNKSRL